MTDLNYRNEGQRGQWTEVSWESRSVQLLHGDGFGSNGSPQTPER